MTKKQLIAMMNETTDNDIPILIKVNRWHIDCLEVIYMNVHDIQVSNNTLHIVCDR